ncbi:MAG: hypothetical protein IIY94_06175, partial [Oscillospiraceae bacterium]|nr:hypothetical protein [Oscillospiraceae bacterium]
MPTELEVFSCVYCGAKHRMDAMPTPTVPADKADYAYAQTHLLDCIRNFPNAYKHFDRKQYAPFFQAHKESLRPVFEAMDRWVCAHPFQSQTIMADFAEAFLRQWEEYHQTHPKSQTRRAAERLFFSDKLTLAWYTVPAIRDL